MLWATGMIHFRRVRLTSWAFMHPRGDRIECAVETHPVGLELRVTFNAELLHVAVFPDARELLQSAEAARGRLEARGWRVCQPLGPEPGPAAPVDSDRRSAQRFSP